MRLWSRGCPRCSGDLFEERHLDSVDLVCLQCGNILSMAQEAQLRASMMAIGRNAAVIKVGTLEKAIAA